ncbi:PREDICTED: GATA transcription factor 26-like [Lupinus angustifolius]|uniref:GATA transcription factor 26-like n=1 Tax=Lupinus angustifolius TaxID=3871 RepID=UPI00092EAEE3|nr:PREDICTED: GATA transcription factor 26-like [Lupinus angustifolius]XP_019423967.1 PREDICTED: GATA transcription factor 26-like [Lupinus angustifolius]
MGKEGPCYHCGVISTPLWRNGPPEKPVLCNACGSRWRTKGTLANYTPLHARAETDNDNQRVSRVKILPLNKNKEVKLLKRKVGQTDYAVSGGFAPDYDQGFRKVVDEDTSNRSSSGSVISNTESCAQFGGTDASDFTGPAQSVVWEAMVPAKKRTCGGRPKHSSVEKLTKDLCTILHEQQSYLSATSEEDLLFESETPMVSVEIGHGSILIRHPSTIAREEESEASSLSVDNKQCLMSEAYSCSGGIPVYSNYNGKVMQAEELKRDKSKIEKLQDLGDHDSPLRLIDLNDVVNYEEFIKNLTNEEQQQLLKYLPVADTSEVPNSLTMMFSSSQFKENLTYFQQLLREGVFDISLLGGKPGDCETLKRLALSNLSKSKWVEHYNFLKSCKDRAGKSIAMGSPGMASSDVVHVKRLRDSENPDLPELTKTMTTPKSVTVKAGCEGKEVAEDGSCFNAKSLFALPRDHSSHMMDSLNFEYENSDQDLLLDVPSNGFFPQAELLHPTASFDAQASTSSSSIYSHVAHY